MSDMTITFASIEEMSSTSLNGICWDDWYRRAVILVANHEPGTALQFRYKLAGSSLVVQKSALSERTLSMFYPCELAR
jgi:hypothetical protein